MWFRNMYETQGAMLNLRLILEDRINENRFIFMRSLYLEKSFDDFEFTYYFDYWNKMTRSMGYLQTLLKSDSRN